MLYWSKCLIGVSSFWNGLLFFFRPPAYLFAKKRTLNNELTKGGLIVDNIKVTESLLSTSIVHLVLFYNDAGVDR